MDGVHDAPFGKCDVKLGKIPCVSIKYLCLCGFLLEFSMMFSVKNSIFCGIFLLSSFFAAILSCRFSALLILFLVDNRKHLSFKRLFSFFKLLIVADRFLT